MATKRKKPKTNRLKHLGNFSLSIFLILAGITMVGYAASKNFNLSLHRQLPEASSQATVRGQARIAEIAIPKIQKNLMVEDGSYQNGRWEVSKEGVSYYTDSSLPEAGGNTVLYGHNKERILGGLVTLKVGDKIDLKLVDGRVVSYEVFEVKTIKPNQLDILKKTEDSRLTIYTCTGFLDSARFVVIAKQV